MCMSYRCWEPTVVPTLSRSHFPAIDALHTEGKDMLISGGGSLARAIISGVAQSRPPSATVTVSTQSGTIYEHDEQQATKQTPSKSTSPGYHRLSNQYNRDDCAKNTQTNDYT